MSDTMDTLFWLIFIALVCYVILLRLKLARVMTPARNNFTAQTGVMHSFESQMET